MLESSGNVNLYEVNFFVNCRSAFLCIFEVLLYIIINKLTSLLLVEVRTSFQKYLWKRQVRGPETSLVMI